MRGKLFDIEHSESVTSEDLLHSHEGQVREMFVIDGIELSFLHQAQQMRKFERDNSVRLQGDLQTFGERVQIGHMRIDVVADEKIRLQITRGIAAEENSAGRNAFRDRCLSDVSRRLDS